MTLPVSSYEELLAHVRNLTSETIQLRHEITSSLCDHNGLRDPTEKTSCDDHLIKRASVNEERIPVSGFDLLSSTNGKPTRPSSLFAKKEDEADIEVKEIDERITSQDLFPSKNTFHPKDWGPESLGLWHSGPSSLYSSQPINNHKSHQDMSSTMSYSSFDPESQSNNIFSSCSRTYSHQQLGVKVEMVYNLLSMLDTNNREDMSKTFLAMSSSPESCHAMRQSGCLPLLIQLIHSPELDVEVRNRAAEALHNIVDAQIDEKRRRREVRVLKLLEQVREYCNELKVNYAKAGESVGESEADKHPVTATGALMKFSFDAEHRQAICTLGGLQAITELIQMDHEAHGNSIAVCITLRRYAGMSLTNLTFGDGKNKALLCSFAKFMHALVDQLKSPSEDLRQVTASVLRNLSWRADPESKQALRDVGTVTALAIAAMEVKKEATLKSILSALWNLSAHCSINKVDICSVPGALAFLVKTLKYRPTSNTLAIIENAGGIIRNISSHIAMREDYRQILRDNNCFEILLEHLKSPSLTVVSNACGTLWNLSARCTEDQRRLWEMGATTMLRSLIQSKHKMISMGSSAALKNLLTANPNGNFMTHLDSTAKSLGLQNLPSLFVRKQRALEQELNITLAETCDNIEPSGSPTLQKKFQDTLRDKTFPAPRRSDSHESIKSTQSDSVYERINQKVVGNENKLFDCNSLTLHESLNEKQNSRKEQDQKFIMRYKTSMIPTPTLKKINQDKINERTREESLAEEDANKSFNETGFQKKVECRLEAKEQCKRGIPVSKIRSKFKVNNNKELIESESENCFVEEDKFNGNSRNIEKFFQNPVRKLSRGLGATVKESNKLSERLENSITPVNSTDLSNLSQLPSSSMTTKDLKDEDKCAGRKPEERKNDSVPSTHKSIEIKYKIYTDTNETNNNLTFTVERKPAAEDGKYKEVGSMENANTARIQTATIFQPPIETDLTRAIQSIQNDNISECFPAVELDLGKPPNNTAEPNFKIGLEITDSKLLQYEASKICREIQKYEEMEMGCSLTSEISLVSCSSFLDAGDYSLFEISTEAMDFEESEEAAQNKTLAKIKNQSLRKPLTSLSGEAVSLPSLGSIKSEQIDLESSIISVASITSEIADTYGKDKECFNTFTKSSKNDVVMESQEETMADTTLLSHEEETLNGDQSIFELCEDENSLHSEENLPLDTADISKNLTSDQECRKLTPKEKRRTFHERYKTYTIRDVKGNITQEIEGNTVAEEEAKVTPEQERSIDKERFLTRTSGKGDGFSGLKEFLKRCKSNQSYSVDDNSSVSGNLEDKEMQQINPITTTFLPEEKHELLKTSKSFEKDFSTMQVFASDSRSLNDLLSIGPAERKELVDNAKLVAISLKTAVQDLDSEIFSDSETEETQKTLPIDTATYNKDSRQKMQDYKITGNYVEWKQNLPDYNEDCKEYLERVENCNGCTDEKYGDEELENCVASLQLQEKKGAKILKSCEKIHKEKMEELSKGIRGRRKPLYTSPLRKPFRGDSSIPNSPKTLTKEPQKYNLMTTKSLPNVSRTMNKCTEPPALNREGTFTKERVIPKETSVRNIRAIPVPASTNSVSVEPAVRSKSVLTLRHTKPVIESSRISKPVSPYNSKNTDKRGEGNSNQRRQTYFEAGSRITGNIAKNIKRMSSPSLTNQEMKNSSSNQSLKSNSSGKSVGSIKSKNSALQSPKSLSNASLSSAGVGEKGKTKTSKKEVTSKIANLWKKVEETRQKKKYIKDTRVWIEPERKAENLEEVLCIEQEEILDIPIRKFVHSFTAQDLANDPKPDRRLLSRNSGDFSHVKSLDKESDKIIKQKIISGVVPPYNYNPPTSLELTPTYLNQVNVVHKGSLKLSTT